MRASVMIESDSVNAMRASVLKELLKGSECVSATRAIRVIKSDCYSATRDIPVRRYDCVSARHARARVYADFFGTCDHLMIPTSHSVLPYVCRDYPHPRKIMSPETYGAWSDSRRHVDDEMSAILNPDRGFVRARLDYLDHLMRASPLGARARTRDAGGRLNNSYPLRIIYSSNASFMTKRASAVQELSHHSVNIGEKIGSGEPSSRGDDINSDCQ